MQLPVVELPCKQELHVKAGIYYIFYLYVETMGQKHGRAGQQDQQPQAAHAQDGVLLSSKNI